MQSLVLQVWGWVLRGCMSNKLPVRPPLPSRSLMFGLMLVARMGTFQLRANTLVAAVAYKKLHGIWGLKARASLPGPQSITLTKPLYARHVLCPFPYMILSNPLHLPRRNRPTGAADHKCRHLGQKWHRCGSLPD